MYNSYNEASRAAHVVERLPAECEASSMTECRELLSVQTSEGIACDQLPDSQIFASLSSIQNSR